MRRMAMALALLLAVVGLVAPTQAEAESRAGLTAIYSRQSSAALADSYADGQPGVIAGTAGANVAATKCPARLAAACVALANAPAVLYSLDSSVFQKAKRDKTCVVLWDTRMNPIPVNMPGSITYALKGYNGSECRETEDRPLDFDLYTKISSEG